MKRLFLQLSIVIMCNLHAYAFQCEYRNPKELFQENGYTFLGKVTKVERDVVTLEISESFGSEVTSVVKLDLYRRHPVGGYAGSKDYEVGSSYLVSTKNFNKIDKKVGISKLHLCDFHKNDVSAEEELKWLRSADFKKSRPAKK